MKRFHLLIAASATAVLAVALAGCATHERNEEKLESQARVSRADAEKTALQKVPDGTVKEGELEKEKGKLIWSFDVSRPGTSDITEVHVDAITGSVIAVEKETAASEAKEGAKEKKKKKEKEENEEKEEKK